MFSTVSICWMGLGSRELLGHPFQGRGMSLLEAKSPK